MLNLEYKCPIQPSTTHKQDKISQSFENYFFLKFYYTKPKLAVAENETDETNEIFVKEKTTKFSTRKNLKVRSSKAQDFQIRVKVFQARQLDGNNIHPMCRVKCANLSKHTKTIRSTNNPFWNEIFFFNFNSSAAELFEKSIEFQVYNSGNLLKDALIGCFKLDIGYVYDEPKNSLINKWLLLSDAEDFMPGAKGYLNVTINVLGPGDDVPVRY